MKKASEIFGDCDIDLLPEEGCDNKKYGVTTKNKGIFEGYSFLNDCVKQLREKRKELKISLNKMSNDLYGNRYYVNYLSKVEKGEIPNVSFEVITRITIYLEQFKNK
jgi:hypothetical protein